MTYHYVNDGPVNFTLNDQEIKIYLNDGVINIKLNATTPVTVAYRLLEDGGRRLTEDGKLRILE